jgi:hypothetical protein
MRTQQLVASGLKQGILSTPNYRTIAGFPECVLQLETFAELVNWLGSSDFSNGKGAELVTVVELVRVANTINRGVNLQRLARWTLLQLADLGEILVTASGRLERLTGEQFTHLIRAKVQEIEQILAQGRLQDAFELVAILAMEMVVSKPEYRAALAEWVVALYSNEAS